MNTLSKRLVTTLVFAAAFGSASADDKPKTCTEDAGCASGQFCEFAPGACGGNGTCSIKPEICTQEFDPVIGCDDKQYSNACMARSHGVSIKEHPKKASKK